jgi:hypothetical protein
MQPKPAIFALSRACIARGTGSSNPSVGSLDSSKNTRDSAILGKTTKGFCPRFCPREGTKNSFATGQPPKRLAINSGPFDKLAYSTSTVISGRRPLSAGKVPLRGHPNVPRRLAARQCRRIGKGPRRDLRLDGLRRSRSRASEMAENSPILMIRCKAPFLTELSLKIN